MLKKNYQLNPMQVNKRPYKIIISGGGTGGHIFPAIAIANRLKQKPGNVEILFVGAKGKMELEKVPNAGYPIKGLWISGLQRNLSRRNLLFPFKVIHSLLTARKIIRRFKPDLVIGTGGFASGPTLSVAASFKIPTLIQEQNSYPGITNKLLAKKVDKICVAYQGLEKYFPNEKILLTGNPVRPETINIAGKKDRALEFFNLSHSKKVILVIGGSLGAATINRSILKFLPLFAEKNYQLIWQTGKTFYNQAVESLKEHSDSGFRTYDFISRMDMAYAAADIIVSRAGAIAISELCCIGKPVILIPSPNVAEDHQTRNAMALVNVKAAELVKDTDAEMQLGEKVVMLMEDEELSAKLAAGILSLASPNAVDAIADVAISLLPKIEKSDA
jgi:UDP-N-acetylglucosamine--N-acetylmuramyl-(pentapeptide) pyrophosphoryl-undecaprenol N-acetylglucosamine transferase